MFARALELTTRPGKLREVIRTLRERVMPVLRAQPGFVEEFILASDSEPDRLVVLSLWIRHEHAERFHRRHYSKFRRALEPLLEFEPVIRTFTVEKGHLSGSYIEGPSLSTRARPA